MQRVVSSPYRGEQGRQVFVYVCVCVCVCGRVSPHACVHVVVVGEAVLGAVRGWEGRAHHL